MTPPRERVCAGAAWDGSGNPQRRPGGNLPSCALCPTSPTYWGHNSGPPIENPWDGTPRVPATPAGVADAPPVAPAEIYAYWPGRRAKDEDTKWGTGPAAFCVMNCGLKTTLRSPTRTSPSGRTIGGQPVHMTCAEEYNRTHHRRTSHADTRNDDGPDTLDTGSL